MAVGRFNDSTFIRRGARPERRCNVSTDLMYCTVLSAQFIIVTYILAFIWLAVFALAAIPVFFLFNMEQTCHNINLLVETTPSINQHSWICMDARQYGALVSLMTVRLIGMLMHRR